MSTPTTPDDQGTPSLFDARKPETLHGIDYDIHVIRRAMEPTGQYGVDLLERLSRIEGVIARLNDDAALMQDALRFITGATGDSPSVWLAHYRQHGGGYEGLQAVARVALDA